MLEGTLKMGLGSDLMSDDENIVVRCPDCERHVTGVNCGSFEACISYDQDDRLSYTLLKCPDCQRPFVTRQEGKVVHTDAYGNDRVQYARPKTIFPSDPERMDPSVPPKIADSYLEARRDFTQAAGYTSAAIMCRRTLEGICAHFNAKGGSLKTKLEDLKNRGIIEARLHEWADHVLRILGNDAAHNVDSVISREDARDALEFTKAIVEYLYVFEAAFKKFKDRRQAKDTTPTSGKNGTEAPEIE